MSAAGRPVRAAPAATCAAAWRAKSSVLQVRITPPAISPQTSSIGWKSPER